MTDSQQRAPVALGGWRTRARALARTRTHTASHAYPPPRPCPSSASTCSVSAYVPNETGKAKLQVERNEYLVNKHFNGWQDEVEKNE